MPSTNIRLSRSHRRHSRMARNGLEQGQNNIAPAFPLCPSWVMALNRCRDNRFADGVVLEVDVAITTSGSLRAFRSVDHDVADRNSTQALRERPASGDGLSSRPPLFNCALVHPSPRPCAGADLVLLMTTLLEIRRSDVNSRASPSRNFVLPNVSFTIAFTTPGCFAPQRNSA
jgi:hypothetical protein